MKLPARMAAAVSSTGAAAFLSANPAAASVVTSQGTMHFAATLAADPCPTTCAAGSAGNAFTGSAAGIDMNGHPFSASWAGTGNMTMAMDYITDCQNSPVYNFFGGGTIDVHVDGGTLVDNGVTTTGAHLDVGITFSEDATVLMGFAGAETVKDSAGNVIGTAQLSGGVAEGDLIPTWPGERVPMTCYQSAPAVLNGAVTYGGSA